MLDDLFTYRLADQHYLTVTNASNHETDLDWFREHGGDFDCEVADRLERLGDARRPGPRCARDRRRAVQPASCRKRMTTARLALAETVAADAEALVCGTGYTGEDGVEILIAPEVAPALWQALVEAGAAPAGLGARDTLRLEVCFHLYGNDLSTDRNPIEAGLGWCCKEETGFIGSEAIAAARPTARPRSWPRSR